MRTLPGLFCCFLLFAASLNGAEIRTIAGNGKPGAGGDGGPAVEAQVNEPFGLCRGPDGALYFCDTNNHRVRKIDARGIITTVAGDGSKGYAGDGDAAVLAKMNEPYEVRFDANGFLYIVERLNHVVRRVDCRTGLIATVAGTGQEGFSGDGGPATSAQFKQPHSIALDREGNLYTCDIGNNRIRKVDMKTGIIFTFAGTGEKKAVLDGDQFAKSPLNGPRAIDFDRNGNLWLALREGNAVYKLSLEDAGSIHYGTIRHMAGTGKTGFTGNGGPAKEATLSGPKGLSVGPDGNIYFADTESHSIRMIDLKTGLLQLIAGTGKKGDGPEGDPLGCAMNRPHGILAEADALYIGDSVAHRVRKVTR
jgi:streptogramin lyase